MVKSMTGYGRGEAVSDAYKIVVELKSVNNRYLETQIRGPKQIMSLEDKIKKTVNRYAARGRVDMFITLEDISQGQKILKVDTSLAVAYAKAMMEIADALNIEPEIDMTKILSRSDLFSMERSDDDLEDIANVLFEALKIALENFAGMREVEGKRLADDLQGRCQTVADLVAQIDLRSPLVVAEYKDKLNARILELLPSDVSLDESKLANEVAVFADRSCINEEIVRLGIHLQQLSELLAQDSAVGRKLDFLMQELNREVNTIGSKANDLTINSLVIDAKSELEKIREQVQNIE